MSLDNKRTRNLRLDVDPILTSLAQQFEQSAFVGSLLLPDVAVDKVTGKYPLFGNEHMRIHDTERPMGAPVKKMPLDAWTLEPFSLKEHSLEAQVDYREEEAAEDVLDLEKYAMSAVMDSLLLQKEIEAVSVIQNPDTYSADHVEALSAGNEFNDPDSDPLLIIQDAMETVRRKINRLPNVMVLGQRTFLGLKNHPKILERIKYTQLGIVTEDLLASMLSRDNNKVIIKVGSGMFEDPVTKINVDLWGDILAMGYVRSNDKQMTRYDHSFGKCFVQKGFPKVSVELTNHKTIKQLAVFMTYKTYITMKDAGFLITNTYAESED
jgi:hypothetical protein